MDILLAVDGSEVSHRAVERVIALAGEFKTSPAILLLYVHLPVPMTFATRHVSKETLDAYYREEGEKELDPARAQLARGPVVYRHHHLTVTDVAAHKKFWVDGLGGTAARLGTSEAVTFSNVVVLLRQGAPAGGTKGTSVNHVGFTVPDIRATLARVRAAGFADVTKA